MKRVLLAVLVTVAALFAVVVGIIPVAIGILRGLLSGLRPRRKAADPWDNLGGPVTGALASFVASRKSREQEWFKPAARAIDDAGL